VEGVKADASDYRIHQIYIQQNPVRKHLRDRAEEYPYSSARPGFDLDPAPQGLKPQASAVVNGAAKAAPFQGKISSASAKIAATPRMNKTA